MSDDESLGQHVARQLEQLILDGSLAPGTQLNEVALAARLGVSRGPIREAARALERSGLVTIIRNRGAFVRAVPLDEALDSYILNGLLFAFGASQLANGVSAAHALELRRLVDIMDGAAAAGDSAEFFTRNIAFHEAVVRFAGNRQVEEVYLTQTRKLQLTRRRAFDGAGSMLASNAEHHGILDAILNGDPALARERAETHSRAGRGRFLRAIEHPSEQGTVTRRPGR